MAKKTKFLTPAEIEKKWASCKHETKIHEFNDGTQYEACPICGVSRRIK